MFNVIEVNGFKDLIYNGNTIPANSIVYRLQGKISGNPSRTSIQIGPDEHIEDDWGQYINHSCNPSVKIVGNILISLKEIKDGESITFDYNQSEDYMANPFYCNCCDKLISGKLLK